MSATPPVFSKPIINPASRRNTLILAQLRAALDVIRLVFTPGADEVLRLHTQGVGHAIDVIEEADDLRRVVNGDIVQAGRPQAFHIRLAHGRGRAGQFLGISAKGAIDFVQGRGPPIAGDGIDEGVGRIIIGEIIDLSPEVMGMRANSVDAVVGFADDDGEHLALPTSQGRLGEHGGAVHLHRRFHDAPVQGHDLHDIPDAASASDRFLEFFFDQPRGLVDGDLADVGHGWVSLE